MKSLLKKSRSVFLVLLIVYVVSFGAGILAGKLKAVDIKTVRNSRIFEFNRSLEYKVPGYGDLLRLYKNWHGPKLMKLVTGKNAAGLGLLIFFNNFVMANATMAIRAFALVPLALYPYGRFMQGVSIVQTAGSSPLLPLLFMEFGGYFLVIGAVLEVRLMLGLAGG